MSCRVTSVLAYEQNGAGPALVCFIGAPRAVDTSSAVTIAQASRPPALELCPAPDTPPGLGPADGADPAGACAAAADAAGGPAPVGPARGVQAVPVPRTAAAMMLAAPMRR